MTMKMTAQTPEKRKEMKLKPILSFNYPLMSQINKLIIHYKLAFFLNSILMSNTFPFYFI